MRISALLLVSTLLLASPGSQGAAWASVTPAPPVAGAQDTEIASLREKYLIPAEGLCAAGKYRDACISCQKLLDILFKKSVTSNFDVWMSAYGNLYKQADSRLRKARAGFEEARKPVLRNACARKQQDLPVGGVSPSLCKGPRTSQGAGEPVA